MDGNDREVELELDEDLDGTEAVELEEEGFEGDEEVKEVGRRLKTGFDLDADDVDFGLGRRNSGRAFSGYSGGEWADPEFLAVYRVLEC